MAGGAVVPPPKAAPKSASAVRPAESPDDVHMAGGAGPGASPSAPAVPVHSVPGASQAAGPAVLPAAVSGAPTSVATQPGESTDVDMVDVAGAPGSASAPAPSSPVASKPSPPKKTKVEEQAAESAEGTRVPLVGQAAVSLEGGGAAGSATSPLTDVPLLQDAFSGEIEVDWDGPGEDGEPGADAFEATAEFRAELEAEVSGATEANIRAGAEHEAARADALPEYLQPERQQWREHSAELATVHAIKSREVEHVRYRCVADFPRDVDIQSVTHQMKVSARIYFHEFHGGAHLSDLDLSPGSASDFGKTFLSEAHKRSLWVTNLENKGGSSDTEGFRTEYSKLLEDIPETAAQKFGESYLESPAARAHLLVGLVNKHSGELVELDRLRFGWALKGVAPGSASAAAESLVRSQWVCREGGEAAGGPELEFGYFGSNNEVANRMSRAITAVAQQTGLWRNQLRADWDKQVTRVRVPCVGTAAFEWVRTGFVVSLGELMRALGLNYTAKQIYYLYRTLRIVAVKRSKIVKAPGSASAGAGMGDRVLQAATLRKKIRNKQQLMTEYAAAIGIEVQDTPEFLNDAVRYLYALILSDMRPPWLEHTFPQALPGNGVLSKYTRPCFLMWDSILSIVVFGPRVQKVLTDITDRVGLLLGGVVARPLYQCMGIRPDGACMSMASMSRIFQGGPGRGEYLCSNCARRGQGAPVSDSAPLRALLLYAVSAVDGDQGHAVRMTPVRIVVSAPPEHWGWGKRAVDPEELQEAQPEWQQLGRVGQWCYSLRESEQIWCSSAPFRGTPAE